MNTKRILSMLLAGSMAVSLCACGSSSGSSAAGSASGSGSASDLKEIDVVLDWYPNAIHTFLYEAIDNGYFEDEGLKVNLISPAESVDAINFVATGKAEIGLTYPVDVIDAHESGMPVEALASVSQKPLDCMVSLKSNKDITSDLSSLKGKKIGHSGNAFEEAVIKTVCENAGLKEGDYESVNVGFDLTTSLTTGNVDMAVGTFINDEVVTMQNEGYDVNVFTESDYGVPELYGLIMAVNTDDYEKNTDTYEAFLRACSKGFDDMKADEDAALELIMSEMNSDDNPLDEKQQRESYEILLPRMQPDGTEFMDMDSETWQSVIDWMVDTDQIDKSFDASEIMLTPNK